MNLTRVIHLGKEGSVADIAGFLPQAMTMHDIKPDEILMAFDVDGTLTNIGPPPLKKTSADKTRGGQRTIDFLHWCDDDGIRWWACSARSKDQSNVSNVSLSLKLMTLIDDAHHCPFPKNVLKSEWQFRGQEYKAFECWRNVGVAQPGSDYAFEKEATIEYIMERHYQHVKMLIFADDNANNVFTVWRHFKDRDDIPFKIFIVLEPLKTESDHYEGLDKLKATGVL